MNTFVPHREMRAQAVFVVWIDSASVNGGLWVARDEINPDVMTKEGLSQQTVGFVIDESDDVLLLAQSIGDRLGAVLAITKTAIVERWNVQTEQTPK